MPLRLADLNKEYEIMRIGGSAEVKQHLADLGFHVGAKVIVVSRSGEGMIVSIKGSRIAVGKDMWTTNSRDKAHERDLKCSREHFDK